jgi:hypothetical protein
LTCRSQNPLGLCSGRRGPRFKSAQPDSEVPVQSGGGGPERLEPRTNCAELFREARSSGRAQQFVRAHRQRLGTELRTVAVSAEEALADAVCRRPIDRCRTGGVDGQRHPWIGMAEAGLSRPHVDPVDHERRGVQPPYVVEACTGTSGGTGSRLLQPASPIRGAQRSTVVVPEHEGVGVLIAQPGLLQMRPQHVGEDIGHEHGAAAGFRLGRPEDARTRSGARRRLPCLRGSHLDPVGSQAPNDYTVVMATHPMSIRFGKSTVLEELKAEAKSRQVSASALAEELIEEGLRTRRHPLIVFRDGPAGRRAGLVNGPDVWEVIGGLVGGDVPAESRIERAIELFGLTPREVGVALDYYADYQAEIDDRIASNLAAADEAEAAWRRRRDLLAR